MPVQRSEKARAATLIRVLLKKHFPNTKFSVRSSSGANVTAVDIDWTDGVPVKDVKKLTSGFAYGTFDPMFDQYNSNNHKVDIPQVKYVMHGREMSPESKEAIEAFIKNEFSPASFENMTPYDFDRWVWDVFSTHNFELNGNNFEMS